MKVRLALENGKVYEGLSAGASGESIGEVVFATSMTGYVEVLTDPSFHGQIVVATQPHMGNHGVQRADWESAKASVAGFVMGDAAEWDGDPRSRLTVSRFLREQRVVAASGLPTRRITLELRSRGALRGVLTTEKASARALVARALEAPKMDGQSLAGFVTTKRPYVFKGARPDGRRRVALLDFGVKRSLLDTLHDAGARVKVYPASTPVRRIVAEEPELVVLSNGPGDPAAMGPEIAAARELLRGKVAILGVCLGHQLLGLAAGGAAYKLKFGHHGANHPVKDLATGKILITTQNHGFAVKAGSLPRDYVATHLSLNDGTLEGFRHRRKNVVALQFHPEGGPGPREARELVSDFLASL